MKLEIDKEILPPKQAFEWPRRCEEEKNWSEAAKRWAVLRRAYPLHPETWLQGANAHIEAGEFNVAESLLIHADQHFSDTPFTYTLSAEFNIRQKQWDEANKVLQNAQEKFPSEVQIWLKSAELATLQDNIELALSCNLKARQCDPANTDALIQYAELAMQEKQWEAALERWESVRSSAPNKPMGYLRASEAATHLGMAKEARKLKLANQYGEKILKEDTSNTSRPQRTNKRHPLFLILELIWTKAKFNLRSEVHQNYLVYGWWVIEPLLHMVAYYVVFGVLLERGGEDYPAFLLTGLIPWMWFMRTINLSSKSIIAGQNLMLQVGLPPIIFPLTNILQTAIKQVPIFILLFGFIWLQGQAPNANWWALFPVILVQALICTSIACLVAALIPFIRDLSYLVPTAITLIMFLSGIFYDYRMISVQWQEIFLLNPVAFLLKCYREILLENTTPDLFTLSMWGIGSAILCVLLVITYHRLRYVYPRVVLE